MPDRKLKRLFQVLDQERTALIDADFAAFSARATDKERILQDLAIAPLAPAIVQRLSDQIARNQVLLAAAIQGIKSAETTVASIKAIGAGTVVYGRNGEVSRLRSSAKGLSHKL